MRESVREGDKKIDQNREKGRKEVREMSRVVRDERRGKGMKSGEQKMLVVGFNEIVTRFKSCVCVPLLHSSACCVVCGSE